MCLRVAIFQTSVRQGQGSRIIFTYFGGPGTQVGTKLRHHRLLQQAGASSVEAVLHVQPPYPEMPYATLLSTINDGLSDKLGADSIALMDLLFVSKQGLPGNWLCETGELTTSTPLPPNAGMKAVTTPPPPLVPIHHILAKPKPRWGCPDLLRNA